MTLTNGILAPYAAISKGNRTSASAFPAFNFREDEHGYQHQATPRCSEDRLAFAEGNRRPELAAWQEPRTDASGDDAVRCRDRCVDRERGAPVDRRPPALLPRRPLVGRERLHAHVRWIPPAGRTPRRPPRVQAEGPDRPGRLLGRVAGRRPRPVRAMAARRARGPGPRRRDRLAGGAVDHYDHARGSG